MSTQPTRLMTRPHFSILATSFAGGPRPRHAAVMLGGLWVLLYFAALFSPPLLDDADATHAQAARAMATTGDLVTLKVDGVRYLEKAPLPYWLAAASFRVFGYNTFAAHLPQALAVLLLMLLGHRWANQAFGSRTGFYTGLGVLTSVGVFLFTRVLIPEVLLAVTLGAALFAFLKTLGPIAVEDPPEQTNRNGEVQERPAMLWYAGPRAYASVMWGSLALAVLSKGLVALVFFLATAGLFLALTGELGSWRKLGPLSGLVLFLAIAAPWHVLAGMRNAGGPDGHGFWWFYLWNEHVLRFVGRRVPGDFNKLPGWAYWSGQLVWMFPWTLFLPLGLAALWRRFGHQVGVLARFAKLSGWAGLATAVMAGTVAALTHAISGSDLFEFCLLTAAVLTFVEVCLRRVFAGLTASPFHRIDPQQRSILLLSLFAAVVLAFFSLSTNQEYYTFPAYMPMLLLIAATITRAEQTYANDSGARRWVGIAHVGLMFAGAGAALALGYGLWSSRHLPYAADVGAAMARRGVGGYTLSMSHFFDLTTAAFAGLRLPAMIAIVAFTVGPVLAWMLRMQRRHVAATTAIAFTGAGFLFAAHLALARFGPMLSSRDFALEIESLRMSGAIGPQSRVLIFGDQAFGSSIPFYLGEPVGLVDGRSTSLLFGAGYADAPQIFETSEELRAEWGRGERKVMFVPAERRDDVSRLLGQQMIVLAETSGKLLVTDRELGR